MKRLYKCLLLILLSIVLVSCSSVKDKSGKFFEGTDLKELGLKVDAKDVTSSGLTLVFDQYDSSLPKGELFYGADYYLERKVDDNIYTKVPVDDSKIAWDAIAYILTPGEKTEEKIDWTFIYGKLGKGVYRIKKVICDSGNTSEVNKFEVYANFEIK